MRQALILLIGLFGFSMAALPNASAQGVVLANSDPVVTIHSNFAGQAFSLFGAIDPHEIGAPDGAQYDAVIVIEGPRQDQRVSMSGRQAGIVLTTQTATYQGVPSYYAVLSSRPLNVMLSPEMQNDPGFDPLAVIAAARISGDPLFDEELRRLRRKAGTLIESGMGVAFLSRTAFAARIDLPSNVANGLYSARAFIFVDGEMIGSTITRFSVRTEGFERFVATMALRQPLLYGVAAVLLALLTGWLGGLLFKR